MSMVRVVLLDADRKFIRTIELPSEARECCLPAVPLSLLAEYASEADISFLAEPLPIRRFTLQGVWWHLNESGVSEWPAFIEESTS